MQRTHELKCWPIFFGDMLAGGKGFELRKDDRDYRERDWLRLREWDPKTESYTGRQCDRQIVYILRGVDVDFGLMPGFCILGLQS